MDKVQKKRIKQVIAWGCAGLVTLGLATMPLLAKSEDDAPTAAIKTAAASAGSVTDTINGGGVLVEDTAVNVTIPSGVKLTAFLVENGDEVVAGDALASVDKVAVMEAIEEVQETLDYLDQQLNSVGTDAGATSVKAQTAGIVKAIYGQAGDSVQDVMLEYGALALLSLDGRMAVDIETDDGATLRVGDSVLVTLRDSDEIAGRVDSKLGNTVIVTIVDEGYEIGASAKVTTTGGDYLGSGNLYIHDAWNATAVYGNISAVKVSENDSVSRGSVLFTLTDTEVDTQRQILVGQRQEYELVMEELFRLNQSGTLNAPCDGIVAGVDEDSAYLLSSEDAQWSVTLLSNVTGELPENTEPDGGDIPSEPAGFTGLIATVAVGPDGTLTYLTDGEQVTVSDPERLTQEQKDTSRLTIPYAYEGNPYLYVCYNGELLLTATKASEGDLVLIVDDQKLVCLDSGADASGDGGQYSGSQFDSVMSGVGQFSGSYSDFSFGGNQTTDAFKFYDLTDNTVLTVTPDDSMSVDITVDELDISDIYVGMEAHVTVAALGAQVYTGTVTQIGTAANSGGSSKFSVTITLPRQSDMLSGMSTCVALPVETRENVLTIPVAALNDDGASVFVYTGYDEKTGTLTDMVAVEIGLSDGENVQIIAGLTENQTVYYAYFDA